MEITYLGHASFRLKGKSATIVTDPYNKKSVGFTMPKTSADIVTISHSHDDHNAAERVSGTSRRDEPYLISAPGEYEVSGVGVFGWGSYHDKKKGEERGKNTIYSFMIDGIRVGHLGDLGHVLENDLVEDVGVIDVLMVPVGGHYTINAGEAIEVIAQLQPSIVIPMHYRTKDHNSEVFAKVDELDVFLKEVGVEDVEAQDKFKVTVTDLPEKMEVVVLKS